MPRLFQRLPTHNVRGSCQRVFTRGFRSRVSIVSEATDCIFTQAESFTVSRLPLFLVGPRLWDVLLLGELYVRYVRYVLAVSGWRSLSRPTWLHYTIRQDISCTRWERRIQGLGILLKVLGWINGYEVRTKVVLVVACCS